MKRPLTNEEKELCKFNLLDLKEDLKLNQMKITHDKHMLDIAIPMNTIETENKWRTNLAIDLENQKILESNINILEEQIKEGVELKVEKQDEIEIEYEESD